MNTKRFCYSPEAGEGGGAALPATAKPLRMPRLPRKDVAFGAVAAKAALKWKATPAITLLWTTATGFEAKANQYNAALSGRKSAGGSRSSHTQSLDALDKAIDKAVNRVKTYILEKWEDEDAAIAQYPRYGIVKRSGSYGLSRSRQQRLADMKLMQEAIAADGFDKKTNGTNFWTDTRSRYEAALKTADDTDSTVSSGVSSKNVLRAELTEVMQALQLVIRGNYPKTYEAEYRAWGWQKEDY